MTPTKRSFLARATLSTLSLALLPLAASAQAPAPWPSKALRIVVGYPAGSSPDVQARLLAEPLARALGQPVVVDNKPGASGNIGADITAKADDGHTIGVIGNGPLTSSKFLYAKLPYDPLKDLAPIALIGTAPLVWVAPKSAVTGSVSDYIKQTRASGDTLAYGSVGAGSGGHLGMELVKEQLGIKPLHVPFNGGPPILNAMMGGQVHMTLLPAVTVAPLVQAGKLTAVAVTSAKRSPLAPDLPSMQEIGASGVNIEVWNAFMAPAKMPAAHQARLSSELGKILGSREIRQKLFLQGWKVDDSSPAALAQRIKSDTAIYGDLIAKKGIKLE
ncbi:Bug family tripartite tricarboxylate transporter substrate binding protein [Rhodoferax ferrireducens]|uniref:Bug family tripartite tricarboxylate transporter substrate binding protein n=1 Tax=Rhodoferax ferrireducens TaxID=192843 RepID=UPI000E0D42CA|nr:tripartite tricarboxylate transporter substrate-binding protein [Rhodoferax ferrireducens]